MLNINFANRENLSPIFGQKAGIPQEVTKYLAVRKRFLLKNNPGHITDLKKYDANRMEGIQNGIKIFEGMNFKQITFFIKNLTEVVLKRGCNNMCAHCYAKAMPPSYKEMPNQLNQITFEDFKHFCKGLKELNNRLGFKPFEVSEDVYNTLFHDADSSMITLTDKNGKVYDYADLAKMLHDVTGRLVLFDTSGWNIQDAKTQTRMEALVKKALSSKKYNFLEFNVSLNPFHSIYNLALKHEKAGNAEKAQQLKNIYIDRLANVIYTLAPLVRKRKSIMKEPCLGFIMRALPNNKGFQGYDKKALSDILDSVYNKLVEIYKAKSSVQEENNVTMNDLKWIKKELDIKSCSTVVSAVGRAENIITDKNSSAYKFTQNEFKKGYKNCNNGIVDLNGRFYITDWCQIYPTDIVVNYSSKGAKTASLNPNLRDFVVTKDLM